MSATAVGSATVTVPYTPRSGCGPGCLPRKGTVARVNPLVRLLRIVSLLCLTIAVAGLGLTLPLLTANGRARAVRAWFRLMLRACGVRLVVHGDRRLSHHGNATLVTANHVSWLDIPAILAVEPVRVLAKTDVRDWPLVGFLAARAGTVFIDRRRLRRLPVTVADIATSLRTGGSVLVFPEGSTWCGRTAGRFYPATLQASIDADAAVRPVALRYRLRDGTPTTVAAFLGDDTLLASAWRVLAARGLVVEVWVHPVLAPQDDRRGAASAAAAAVRVGHPALEHAPLAV